MKMKKRIFLTLIMKIITINKFECFLFEKLKNLNYHIFHLFQDILQYIYPYQDFSHFNLNLVYFNFVLMIMMIILFKLIYFKTNLKFKDFLLNIKEYFFHNISIYNFNI